MKNFAKLSLIAPILLLASIVSTQSATYSFTSVAETSNDTFPFFSGFSDFPVINNNGIVAFRASADFSTFRDFTGPSTGGGPYADVTETDFSLVLAFDPVINDANTVALYAFGQSFVGGTSREILTAPASGAGPVVNIADNNDPTFRDFSFPAINNSNTVAFVGSLSAGGSALFSASANGGALTPIIDTGGPFSSLGTPWLNSTGLIAFRGKLDSGPIGIFVTPATGAGPVTTVADTTGGQFSAFGSFTVINGAGTVVFQANEVNGLTGIFAGPAGGGGPITTVADSSGSFSNFINSNSFLFGPLPEFATNENGAIVFYANLTSGGFGLFNGPDPVANRIIGSGDELFCSTVTNLALSRGGLNDAGQVAFYFELADGRSGVALATAGTPQPAPQVSLDVSPNNVNKTGEAVFTATASAPPLFPITVPFSMSGDAEQDVDYELDTFSNQIVIPAGHTSGSVKLTVTTTKTQGKEQATMTLQPGCGYTLGNAKSGSNGTQASVKINNKKAN